MSGDDGDFVAGGRQRERQRVHVAAEAADDDRGILPREHEYADHGDSLPCAVSRGQPPWC
jgi:hypothetical protein